MEYLEVNSTKVLTVPNGVNKVKVSHEWGDVMVQPTTVTPGASYSLISNSIGVIKLQWLLNAVVVDTVFYDVFLPLITSAKFFAERTDLAAFTANFDAAERKVRTTVQNYTGQKFGPVVAKTMEIQGDGGESLELPVQILSLTSITNMYGEDITDLVRVSPNDSNFLQRNPSSAIPPYYDVKRDLTWPNGNLFSEDRIFSILGNFGWEYVPPEVVTAATMLIADLVSSDDVSEMRQKGVFESHLGDFSIKLNADQWGTTGNNYADNLLSPHVKFGIGLI